MSAVYDFSPIFIRIPPENLVELIFILETYEGLGVLRTLNRSRGEAVILTTQSLASTLREMLGTISAQLKLEYDLPAPANYSSDDEGLSLLADEE